MKIIAACAGALLLSGPAFAGTICVIDKVGLRTCTEQAGPVTSGAFIKSGKRPEMRFIIKKYQVKPVVRPLPQASPETPLVSPPPQDPSLPAPPPSLSPPGPPPQ